MTFFPISKTSRADSEGEASLINQVWVFRVRRRRLSDTKVRSVGQRQALGRRSLKYVHINIHTRRPVLLNDGPYFPARRPVSDDTCQVCRA